MSGVDALGTFKVFPVFRAGTHLSLSGRTIAFTPADVSHAAAGYDAGRYAAPLVLGHPADNMPRFGTVVALHCDRAGALFAEAAFSPSLVRLVKDEHYRYVSAAFFSPNHPDSPAPGTWSLRHVGLLGAAAPAVKGLPPLEFAQGRAGSPTAVGAAHAFDPGPGFYREAPACFSAPQDAVLPLSAFLAAPEWTHARAGPLSRHLRALAWQRACPDMAYEDAAAKVAPDHRNPMRNHG